MYYQIMRTLILVMAALPLAAQVKFEQQADRVAVEVGGKPFTTFYFAGEAPKPYLHPLVTASGKRLTRLYPMENVAGETKDHQHHRGLWFTHGDVNGFDFWMNEPNYKNPKKGVIKNGKVISAKGGKAKGTLEASCDWESPEGTKLLTEKREMTFSAGKDLRIVDFDVTFTAATKVTFGDTKEGFFAIRFRDELTENKGTGTMTNAAGAKKMKDVWGKASPWVDYSGTLEGAPVGITILDHPKNPKHPTYWHSRDYGLFAANQFGEHDFFRDKTKNGSLTIEPGQSLRFRYRVVIHEGPVETAAIAGWFAEYAKTK